MEPIFFVVLSLVALFGITLWAIIISNIKKRSVPSLMPILILVWIAFTIYVVIAGIDLT